MVIAFVTFFFFVIPFGILRTTTEICVSEVEDDSLKDGRLNWPLTSMLGKDIKGVHEVTILSKCGIDCWSISYCAGG